MTNNTFHNGDMHNVQHIQAMLERGVCELAHFFFHLSNKNKHSFNKKEEHLVNFDALNVLNKLSIVKISL